MGKHKLGALIGGAVISVIGFVVLLPHGKQLPPRIYVVAIDRSASTNGFRKSQLDHLDMAVLYAIKNRSKLLVYDFGPKAEQVWSRVPNTPDDLNEIKRKRLSIRQEVPQEITRPGLLLELIIKDLQFESAKDVRLVILTDGDSEDSSDNARFRLSARSLAGTSGMHTAIIGISPENRATWQAVFAPGLGARFNMAGHEEGRDTLNECLR